MKKSWSIVIFGLCASCSCASAQTGGHASKGDAAISDGVKRQADGPFRWILLHSRKDAKPIAPPVDTTTKKQIKPEEQKTKDATASEESVKDEEKTPAKPPTAASSAASDHASAASKPAALESNQHVLRLVRQVSPTIPDRLLMDVMEETVVVRCKVLPDGSVKVVRVVKSTQAKLNAHVITAIEQWRYQPTPREQEVDITVIIRP